MNPGICYNRNQAATARGTAAIARPCRLCGEPINIGRHSCPQCGALVQVPQAQSVKRFVRLFVALAIFCLVAILWLPR